MSASSPIDVDSTSDTVADTVLASESESHQSSLSQNSETQVLALPFADLVLPMGKQDAADGGMPIERHEPCRDKGDDCGADRFEVKPKLEPIEPIGPIEPIDPIEPIEPVEPIECGHRQGQHDGLPANFLTEEEFYLLTGNKFLMYDRDAEKERIASEMEEYRGRERKRHERKNKHDRSW